MLASAIRELAASRHPQWIAAAYFEKTVQIWDPNTQRRISEFSTVFHSGAKNLAFALDAGMLVAGLSKARGKVVAYEVPSGKKLWERKLIHPNLLRFHTSGESVFCTVNNNRSVVRLDRRTGMTLEILEGIEQYIEGPYGDALSVPALKKSNPFCLLGRGGNFNISKVSFALLDAQFLPRSVCLSEACGPVRCISCIDGSLEWMFEPGIDKHVLRLHYSAGMDTLFGILTNLNKKGIGSRSLVRFEVKGGACEHVCELDSWEEAFLHTTDQLITSAGEIRNLSNGVLVDRLDFPSREYPDE